MHDQMPRVFLCYSLEDVEFIVWLSQSLQALGHHVWVDHEQIAGGLPTFDAIHKALDQSDIMLLVITPEAMQSRLVNSEWTYFYCECGKKLIPIALRPLQPSVKLNFMLASLQSIDFHREDREASLSLLHRTLTEAYPTLPGNDPDAIEVPNSFRTPNRWTAQDKLPTKQAGLTRVHLGMPIDVFTGWVRQAQHTLRLLNTWTGIFYDRPDLLITPIELGCTVQILLLDPSSPFAKQRSLDIYLGSEQPDVDEVPKNIQISIRQLASVYAALGGSEDKLELRLYNVMPSFSLHQCDQRALIGFFPHTTRTTTFPMLEVEMETPLGSRFSEEFEAIWNSAMPIDLSPRIPERVEGANQALPEPLSSRELEILRLIAAGFSNQEIAQKLVVTMATVKKHINNMYSKLGVKSRTRAILHARTLNLI
jgi:DNA-binding CsgD family transcriptional regulator